MLGLIIAEKEESGNLIKTIKAKTMEFNGIRFYIGSYKEKQAIICFCGMGKANAAAAAMSMIINFNVDKIFNIGLCGTCRPNIELGTLVIADNIQYHDVDLTPLNYPLNQIPGELISYQTKIENINLLKQILENYIVGTVSSSDSFVTIHNVEMFPTLTNKEIVGVDMEAASLAQICYKTKTDFLCVKIVSDNLTLDNSSKEQYRKNFKELPKLIEKVCLTLIYNI